MKVEYQNHYLTDMDVANFARLSFAKLAENFTEAQNHNLIRFLARGMQSKDWEELISRMLTLAPADQTFTMSDDAKAEVRKKAHDLAVTLARLNPARERAHRPGAAGAGAAVTLARNARD